jgi:hypothetical protein
VFLHVPEGVDTIFNSGYGVAGAYERDPIEVPQRVIVFDDKNGGFVALLSIQKAQVEVPLS